MPAPGGLAIIQDFVNTLDVEGEKESLVRPASFATWLEKWELAPERLSLTEADLARAKELREALRPLLLANTAEPLDPTARATLTRLGRDAALTVCFTPEGEAHLEPGDTGVNAAVGRLLAIVFTAMAEGTWVRLKACRSHTCQWAFYDASKNRSGAWCTMALCGNRSKVRAYQQRTRSNAR